MKQCSTKLNKLKLGRCQRESQNSSLRFTEAREGPMVAEADLSVELSQTFPTN